MTFYKKSNPLSMTSHRLIHARRHGNKQSFLKMTSVVFVNVTSTSQKLKKQLMFSEFLIDLHKTFKITAACIKYASKKSKEIGDVLLTKSVFFNELHV